MATHDRGFASMNREKQREIASKGGKAAHAKGTAHEWSPTEAREAGRKGGIASHRKRADGDAAPSEPLPPNAVDAFSYDW
jgi:hypothetical protein